MSPKDICSTAVPGGNSLSVHSLPDFRVLPYQQSPTAGRITINGDGSAAVSRRGPPHRRRILHEHPRPPGERQFLPNPPLRYGSRPSALQKRRVRVFLLTSEGPAREFRGEQEVHYRSTRTLDRHRDTTRLRSRLGDTPGIAVSPAAADRRMEILILD